MTIVHNTGTLSATALAFFIACSAIVTSAAAHEVFLVEACTLGRGQTCFPISPTYNSDAECEERLSAIGQTSNNVRYVKGGFYADVIEGYHSPDGFVVGCWHTVD
jgi:hypothetical protein